MLGVSPFLACLALTDILDNGIGEQPAIPGSIRHWWYFPRYRGAYFRWIKAIFLIDKDQSSLPKALWSIRQSINVPYVAKKCLLSNCCPKGRLIPWPAFCLLFPGYRGGHFRWVKLICVIDTHKFGQGSSTTSGCKSFFGLPSILSSCTKIVLENYQLHPNQHEEQCVFGTFLHLEKATLDGSKQYF